LTDNHGKAWSLAYLEKHLDENGERYVDFVMDWNSDSGTYEFEGIVPAGYRRHSK